MSHIAIEDCLELLTGLNTVEGYSFTLEKEDYNILTSVARQVFKGTALTDRQFDMLVRKFEKYTTQFEKNGIDISTIISNQILRTPFRTVDRTQRVFIQDGLIVAQFPFNKKLISKIEKFRSEASGQVTNNKNKWKFELSERNVKVIGDTLEKFEFSQEFRDLYDVIKTYKYEDFVPGIYKENDTYVLKNVHPVALENAKNECGEFNENIIKYVDRRKQYGLVHCDLNNERTRLSERIAFRNKPSIYIASGHYTFDDIVESLVELDRFPIVAVIDEDKVDTVYDIYNSVSKFVKVEDQSIMFRLSNETDKDKRFNNWVKQERLNNWVDNNTKVVYISANKIPKPVIKNCTPQCILNASRAIRAYGAKYAWLNSITDLKITHAVERWIEKDLEVIE